MAETIVATAPAADVIPAKTDAPSTEPSGYMKVNGDFGDNAPDVIKSLMEKKQWTNVEQMGTGYTELEKMKGGSAIPEADDAEGWAKINAARGVPESFDKYEYSTDSGIELTPELRDGFKQMAHSAGYTPEQLKGAVDFQLEAISEQTKIYDQQMQEKADADITATKEMYGINYENAIRDADTVSSKHGFTADIEAEGIKGLPIVTKLLNHIANLEAEDGIGSGAPADLPKSLEAQMEEITKDPRFTNRLAPNRKELMVRYSELNRKIAQSRQA
jgi:hypothetical protein